MNKLSVIFLIVSALTLLNSCSEQAKEQKETTPKIKVKVSQITIGYLPDYIEFSGKTIYLNNSNLVAPISGYLTKVNVQRGGVVSKGKLLFEMQTPEAYLINKNDSTSSNYGIIKIYAPTYGRIANLNITNKGVFIDKGSVMCSILASNDFKIQVNIPFEYNEFAKIGNKCKIILPDNTEITGSFSKYLPQINEASQTLKVLASIKTNQFLPENMIVRVLIDKSKTHKTQILPKKCLQTDALMTKFWVMKLINDTTAIQVPVTVGNQNHDKVEIISPEFNTNDLFISEGSYGLSDTVLIEKN